MIEQALIFFGSALAIIVAYGLIRFRLMQVTQQMRIRSVCIATELLDLPMLSPKAKKGLIMYTQNSFNGWMPWLLFCSAVIMMIAPHRLVRLALNDISEDDRVRIIYLRVIGMFVLCILATSPLAALLTFLVISLGMTFHTLTGTAVKVWRAGFGQLFGRDLHLQH